MLPAWSLRTPLLGEQLQWTEIDAGLRRGVASHPGTPSAYLTANRLHYAAMHYACAELVANKR